MKKQTKGLLIVVGLLAFFFATSIHTQQAVITRADLEPAMAVQKHHSKGLMAIPDVVGNAVGVNRAGRPVIKIFTRRAGVGGLPGRLDGFPVRVEVVGEIEAYKGGPGSGVDSTARFDRPVPIGISTGHPAITAGTIGARVTDGTDVWALSNNHVYADTNMANIGDDVIQPGTFDGGSLPDDFIGTLDDFEMIDFDNPVNIMDAAIAITTTALLGNSTPSNGYGTPLSITAVAVPRMRVQKYGRTTQLTNGRVDSIGDVSVNYGAPKGVADFVDQIFIRPGSFSSGGDSGSLVVGRGGQDDRKPVALLFAGSSLVTIVSPIDPILTRFGVTVDGE